MSSFCLTLIKSRGLIPTQSWHLDTSHQTQFILYLSNYSTRESYSDKYEVVAVVIRR